MPDQLPAVPDAAGSVLNVIARAAADPSVDIDKLQALLAMQERVSARENAQRFNADMAEAQAEMEPVVKNAANSHLGNRYARLEAIDKAIRPIYTRHGFSVRYRCDEPKHEGSVKVVCILSHRAGHVEESPIEAPMDAAGSRGQQNKPGVQAVGSTITYLRRYALTMAFNVVMENDSDDDDGEATRRAAAPSQQRRQPVPADPKAVRWKDDVVVLFSQTQTEAAIDALWKKIKVQYDHCRTAWPGMADDIDAADTAARDRIRQMAAPSDGSLPDVVIPGAEKLDA